MWKRKNKQKLNVSEITHLFTYLIHTMYTLSWWWYSCSVPQLQVRNKKTGEEIHATKRCAHIPADGPIAMQSRAVEKKYDTETLKMFLRSNVIEIQITSIVWLRGKILTHNSHIDSRCCCDDWCRCAMQFRCDSSATIDRAAEHKPNW